MTSISLPVSSLRAHLLSSLASLPGTRTFHLHILVSSPRKPTQSLFPYASPRPKCILQDILVLLSEQSSCLGTQDDTSSVVEQGSSATTSLQPRTFVTAIEASLFSFPSSDSSILYICKVDGTGQGIFPSPTSTLLHAFVLFYASPRSPIYMTPVTHHLWIHLFARAQRQYLFPNSADHPKKKPLGDVALCKWWKKNLSNIAKAVEDMINVKTDSGHTTEQSSRLYYLLPGQSEQEASYLLQETHPSPIRWIYSHPYDIHSETLPCPSDPDNNLSSERNGPRPIASLIPHFEDDPKSRFLDELAATSEEHSVAVPIPTPKKKRQKIGDRSASDDSTLTNHHHDRTVTERRSEQTSVVSTRLPSPPEIVYIPPSSSPPAGGPSPTSRPSTPKQSNRSPPLSPHTPQLPTFPISLLSPKTPTLQKQPTSSRTPQTPRTPRRPVSDLDTISISEFWERISYRQECAQGAVTGFFVAVFSCQSHTPANDGESDNVLELSSTRNTKSKSPECSLSPEIFTPLLLEGTVPHSMIKRVMSSLLTGVEFSTTERSHKGTQVIETAIEGLCDGLGQMSSSPLSMESQLNNVEVQTKETGSRNFRIYQTNVYASLSVANPPLARTSSHSPGVATSSANPPINVLSVRRKKKRE